MQQTFDNGDWVLLPSFPEHPAMRVIGQLDNKVECRYLENGTLKSGLFYKHELNIRPEEFPGNGKLKDDYVRYANLVDSPIMIVVQDCDNNRTCGCRYIANGVIHYQEFTFDELERLSDDEVLEYEDKIRKQNNFYSNN